MSHLSAPRQLARRLGWEKPNGVWEYQKCGFCGKLLDPGMREAMNSIRGIVCSMECDDALWSLDQTEA